MTDTGMTGDTNPANPVHNYNADIFPIGAVLTVAYGANVRPFCTLGNLYRILGFLYGHIPAAQPDPAADPPILDIDQVIDKYRDHARAALPEELRAIDPPPAGDDGGTADYAWVAGIVNKYGPTIQIPATPETPTQSR